MKRKLKDLAEICVNAQEHCSSYRGVEDDALASMFECTSYHVACVLAQNTKYGKDGIEWEIIQQHLLGNTKTVKEWMQVLKVYVKKLGGWHEEIK